MLQYGVRRHVARGHMDVLPLTEPVLLILLSLAEQPRHGYSILKDVEQMSDGRVTLSTGTLYGALRRLLEDGWIQRFEQDDSSRGRQAYRLTPAGRRNLQLEATRLKHLARVANLRVARKEL
jgi:DNA-binding PadR family transcriptional regulator